MAEPQSRPEYIHEYLLTDNSLYAAVSLGLETQEIIGVLETLSKTYLHDDVKNFIRSATENYGKVKLVLYKNQFYVESPYKQILETLLSDSVISQARVGHTQEFITRKGLREKAARDLATKV